MTPDAELLRRYAQGDDQAAFAEVVRRHVNLVYAVALRVTSGNAALAEDVAQTVFMDMARKAGPLTRHEALAGWLHTSARFAALKAIRGEQRRQRYEQEAFTMHNHSNMAEFDWEQLRPVLDEAVGRLRETDRHAVVLRFFQGLSHREIGEALGLNENTARKRTEHALEKLRSYFARAGITVSATLLASTLSAHSQECAPVGLAEKITRPSLAGAAGGASVASATWWILLMSTKTKVLLTVVILAAVIVYLTTGASWHRQPPPDLEKPASTSAAFASPVIPKSVAPAALSPSDVAVAPLAELGPAPAPPAPPAAPRAEQAKRELHPMIVDIVSLLKSGDFLGAVAKYSRTQPPPRLNPEDMPPELAAQFRQRRELLAQTPASKLLIAEYETILEATPTLNESGNVATYTFDATTWARIAELGGKSQDNPRPIRFYKINDQWYMETGNDP